MGPPLLLLPSDRQSCLTLMAISAAELPRLGLCFTRLQQAVTEPAVGQAAGRGLGGLPVIVIGSSCETLAADEAAVITAG